MLGDVWGWGWSRDSACEVLSKNRAHRRRKVTPILFGYMDPELAGERAIGISLATDQVVSE